MEAWIIIILKRSHGKGHVNLLGKGEVNEKNFLFKK